MRADAYLQMAATEDAHWWFVGRRTILRHVLTKIANGRSSLSILELGSGTGGNLEMLSEFGNVRGVETDETARQLSIQRTGGRFDIRSGTCPDRVPFLSERFDLICLFDVLEHVERDVETLQVARGLLQHGGTIVITVPAYPWLWSSHDEHLHHVRRYSDITLLGTISAAGLHVRRLSHFNALLFPLLFAARAKDRLWKSIHPTGTRTPSTFVNRLLTRVFSFEAILLRRFDLPFGASLLAVIEDTGA